MEKFTVLTLFREVANLLQTDFPPEEIQSLQRIIFEKQLGLPLHKIFLNPPNRVNPNDAAKIIDIVSKLKLQKPIQYILGEADFFGLIFKVTPDVLIPRQETEELVDWILKSSEKGAYSIVDIGTGSGCIAVSLAVNLPNSKVTAIDISSNALEIAAKNAISNGVSIDFSVVDFLDVNARITDNPFDIVVSNPPYIRELEKSLMKSNVLDHEPHSALFVSNNDPLIFYQTIAQRANELLNHNGVVYCEINESMGKELHQLFSHYGFTGVEIRKDLNGKDRMLKATAPW